MATVDAYEGRIASPEATRFGAVAVNRVSYRHVAVDVSYADGTGEKDTGFDFEEGDIVDDVLIEVLTAEATGGTKTIDVGLLSSETGGDTDGLVDGVSVAAAGVYKASVDAAGITVGALMRVDTNSGVDTAYEKEPHIILPGKAKSLVFQLGGAMSEFEGRIHIFFRRLESERA